MNSNIRENYQKPFKFFWEIQVKNAFVACPLLECLEEKISHFVLRAAYPPCKKRLKRKNEFLETSC